MQKKSKLAMEGILILVLLLFTACATPVGKSNRVGLFDRLEGKSGRRVASNGINTVDEKDLVEAPEPGAVLELSGEWQWPLKNVDTSSKYGERGRKFHQGVDFRAATGTPVYAASDGRVIYVGSKIRGYGRMVVIKHANNIFTVYGHHSKNLVKSGQDVTRGDVIALAGRSGRATGPHLHFELRKGTVSYNPVLAINDRLQNNNVDRRFASLQEKKKKRTRRATTKKSARPITNKTASVNRSGNKNL